MLEFYNDQDGAENILKDYAYDKAFPANPNAHIYLYEFLKKNNAPEKKLIKVLEVQGKITCYCKRFTFFSWY